MERARAFWKQSGVLVTGFAHKYHFDPFFRTEWNIIALQISFAVFILFVFSVAFSYLYLDISSSLVQGIQGIIDTRNATPGMGDAIIQQLEYVKTKNFIIVAIIIVVITTVFGYIIARVTLTPARNALSSQKQFIGNIAHELRTPLSIIKTNTEVALLDDDLDKKMRKMFLSNIEELDRLSDIINNLLSINTFVRPEQMDFRDTDLSLVTDGALQKLTPFAKRRGLEIFVKKSNYTVVWGNTTALEQIIVNLLKNAIYYSHAGGKVNISIEPTYHGYIDLIVEDFGVGIPQKDLSKIFEPFYRAEHSRARQHGGMGLGLTIVSELTKLHQGKISIKSAPKEGTTVTVTLPCGKNAENNLSPLIAPKASGEIAVDFSERHL